LEITSIAGRLLNISMYVCHIEPIALGECTLSYHPPSPTFSVLKDAAFRYFVTIKIIKTPSL